MGPNKKGKRHIDAIKDEKEVAIEYVKVALQDTSIVAREKIPV